MVGGRLVTAAGTVVDLADVSASDIDRADLLLAARVSLGALGVLSEVRVQTVPAFRLHKVEEVRPLAEVLEDLDELVAGHHHVELYALPWSSRSLLLRSRRTDEPAAPPPRWRTWLTDELVNNTGLGLLQRTGRPVPGRDPDPRPADRAAGLRQLRGSTTATGSSPATGGCGSPSRSGRCRGPLWPRRCSRCSP